MKLIIVESPTKSKTIEKFLGKDYLVKSSFGHIRDLPKSDFGVDINNNFEPKYVIPLRARKIINSLKNEILKTTSAILATDEDREGEAIAWHLSQILSLKNPKRIVFHEITKQAIEKALKNPREINMNLVSAQQARRVLDRIVGYKLSPFLWKKITRGLSAGRVQSVALKLVAEREKEIENFKPQEYWTVSALLKKQKAKNKKQEFEALLTKKAGKTIPKLGIKSEKEAEEIIDNLKKANYEVKKIDKKEIKKNPLPPLKTSVLQQEAWKKFGFPAKLTMGLAQNLYEKGRITYHRTDSLNLSEQSLFAAKKFIEKNFGKNYHQFRKYKSGAGAQQAHEAIRPTLPSKTAESIKLEKNQKKIYELVWQRFMASQASPAVFYSTSLEIEAEDCVFRTSGQTLKFDGFLKIYPMKFEEKELPDLKKNEILNLLKLLPSQHFTQPAPRYTEATLIKTLEQNGIGRPSTYAPILSTIQERNYIQKNQQRRFSPTEIGKMVNNILINHFPKIVDIGFTAKMEENLDEIAKGKENWKEVCQNFYEPFEKNLQKKYQEVSKKNIIEKETGKKCPKCGSPLIIRLSRFGKFYACSGFPKCKHAEPLEQKTLGIKCPKCNKGEIIEKRTRKRKIFYACNQFPKCDFALWNKPVKNNRGETEKCPRCGSLMTEAGKKKIKCSNKNCSFEKIVLK